MRFLLTALFFLLLAAPCLADNWYTDSFWLLHEDHHTSGVHEVGRDADLEETSRLVGLAKPDMIQIHAKGNPGWTTYPTKIGHAPPKLANDVLAIWRDVARRDGYHFSAYYNIGRDGEIMKRRPEWNRMFPDGSPVDRALCYHSGVAEGYLWPMIREIMTGYQPQGFWFDGSCFTIRQCYCPKCTERFLKEHDMDAPEKPGDPGWAAYHEMQRQIYREFVAGTCREIHKIDPDCLVSVNWAYSIRMPEKPDPGIAYLTGDIGNRVEGLSAEAHWYDSTGLPFDLMTQVNTLQPADDAGTRMTMRPKPRPQIEQEMAIIIANGGRFNAWDNPTPESGLIPERFEFMGQVMTPFLRSRQPWCEKTERMADVSLLHSASIHYATTETAATSFTKRNNRLDGATQLLPTLHLNYEMLPDWRLEAGDVGSSLVIVEHPKGLHGKTADHLLQYVRDGGSLLLTGMGLTQDKRFADLFGVTTLSGPKNSEKLTIHSDGTTYEFDHWLFKLESTGAKTLLEVQGADGEEYPFLTSRGLGKGRLYYVSLPLLTSHGEQAVPKPVLEAVFEQVLPVSQRLLDTSAPETVEVVLRRQGDRRIVHLVNMATGERELYRSGKRAYPFIKSLPQVPSCSVSIRLPQRPTSVRLQPRDEAIEKWQYEDGRLTVEVPGFAVHQIVVIE
jgi:glycosyl hydrolase family 42 (putative beta-galactosidase)